MKNKKKKRGLPFFSASIFCICLGTAFYFVMTKNSSQPENTTQEIISETSTENKMVKNTSQEITSETSIENKTIKNIAQDSSQNNNEVENNTEPLGLETEIEPQTETVETFSFSEIKSMEAGTILKEEQLSIELTEQLFFAEDISQQVRQRIWNISYKENPYISLSELRYLRILHWGFDEKIHIGELIVNKSISQDILEIMKELFENRYPIEKMILIEAYDGDDEASMSDNNTSAFNYRMMTGTNKLSKHGMGLAIDINPKYNPYVKKNKNGEWVVSPLNAWDYVDRNQEFQHKLTDEDLCVQLFLEHGFTWGGHWNRLKDYQHFEK